MRARVVLLLAALLLAPAYLVSPPSAPPLYDGLGFPDEPYRAVGTTSAPAPTSAFAAGDVHRDGSSPPLLAATTEVGPQARVTVPQGALRLPPAAGQARVRVEPVPVPVPAPRTGRVLSNAYRVSLTTQDGAPLRVDPDRPATVQLRVAVATEGPVVLQQQDGRVWRDLPTRRAGVDVHGADLVAPGVVVAVAQEARLAASDAPQDQHPVAVLGGAGALLAAAVLLVRARRRPQHDR